MTKLNQHTKRTAVIAALLILLAMFLRMMKWMIPVASTVDFITGVLRASIYIGLFFAWGVSVRQRIIQIQLRRYLTAISVGDVELTADFPIATPVVGMEIPRNNSTISVTTGGSNYTATVYDWCDDASMKVTQTLGHSRKMMKIKVESKYHRLILFFSN